MSLFISDSSWQQSLNPLSKTFCWWIFPCWRHEPSFLYCLWALQSNILWHFPRPYSYDGQKLWLWSRFCGCCDNWSWLGCSIWRSCLGMTSDLIGRSLLAPRILFYPPFERLKSIIKNEQIPSGFGFVFFFIWNEFE